MPGTLHISMLAVTALSSFHLPEEDRFVCITWPGARVCSAPLWLWLLGLHPEHLHSGQLETTG